MEIILRRNETDREMVEIWQKTPYRNILFCVSHIDIISDAVFRELVESGKSVLCRVEMIGRC